MILAHIMGAPVEELLVMLTMGAGSAVTIGAWAWFRPRMKQMIAAAALLLLAAAPSDQQAIETKIQHWLDGFNAGNIAPINDAFSDDLVYMTSGVKGTLTKAQIIGTLSGDFAKYKTHVEGITDEIRISGDMAYDRGHFTMTFAPKAGGNTITQSGEFLETWQKESDGQWRVTRLANLNDPSK